MTTPKEALWRGTLGRPDPHGSSAWNLSTMLLILRAMRPQQWTKNVLLLAAPAAAGVLSQWHVATRVAVAVVAFCLVASATYLVNDVFDASSDQRHPGKRLRPIASGALRPSSAAAAALILFCVAIALAVLIGPWTFALLVTVYAILNIGYSAWLKTVPVTELAVVASCYVLRAVAGGIVAGVALSNWFLVFTSFGALFVVTGKRTAEYVALGEHRGHHRPVLEEYSSSFLRSVLILASTVTVASYCLWAFDPKGPLAHAGHHVVWVELTVVPLVLAVLHVLRLLDAGRGGEPERLVLRDHLLQSYAVEWIVLMGIGLYA